MSLEAIEATVEALAVSQSRDIASYREMHGTMRAVRDALLVLVEAAGGNITIPFEEPAFDPSAPAAVDRLLETTAGRGGVARDPEVRAWLLSDCVPGNVTAEQCAQLLPAFAGWFAEEQLAAAAYALAYDCVRENRAPLTERANRRHWRSIVAAATTLYESGTLPPPLHDTVLAFLSHIRGAAGV